MFYVLLFFSVIFYVAHVAQVVKLYRFQCVQVFSIALMYFILAPLFQGKKVQITLKDDILLM